MFVVVVRWEVAVAEFTSCTKLSFGLGGYD
jgi:hypothetical protein